MTVFQHIAGNDVADEKRVSAYVHVIRHLCLEDADRVVRYQRATPSDLV